MIFDSGRSMDKCWLGWIKLDKMLTEDMSRLIAMVPSEMSAMGQSTLNGPIEASKEMTPFNLSQE